MPKSQNVRNTVQTAAQEITPTSYSMFDRRQVALTHQKQPCTTLGCDLASRRPQSCTLGDQDASISSDYIGVLTVVKEYLDSRKFTLSLSFVTLERSSGSFPDVSTSTSTGGKASTIHSNRRKCTQGVMRNFERSESVRTSRHQTHCRLAILMATQYRDLGEVETIREVQQSTWDRVDTSDDPQVEGPGEFG
jgi:hypothetical protein